jgi:competence protein ComEC
MNQPLRILALFFGAGTLLGDCFPLELSWLFLFALLNLLAAVVWKPGRPYLFCSLFLALGWLNVVSHTAIISPQDLRVLFADRPEYVIIRGELLHAPREKIVERRHEESIRSIARVNVRTVVRGTNVQNAFGTVMVSTPDNLPPEFFSGQAVEIAGVLEWPHRAFAPGLFDYRNYLRRQGIYYQLNVRSARDWNLGPTARITPPLADRFFNWAKKMLARGLPEEDESLRLLWAMTLDWKTPMTEPVEEPFLRAGTYHIFAVDGLRMTIISAILLAILRAFQVPRGWCGLIVIPTLWFYAGLTGWSASAIRSTIMMTIIVLGWALQRPADLLNSLTVAALVILCWDPQQLFQAGFQLSFLVVLVIALLMPVLEKIGHGIASPDPLQPAETLPRWRQVVSPFVRFLAANFSISLAAWVGSIPLVAYYFNLFTPSSVLANMAAVPLTMAALVANVGALLAGSIVPSVAELFNHAAWLFMKWIAVVSEWCAALPGGYFYVKAPSLASMVIYYGVLLAMLCGWLLERTKRALAVAALVVLSAIGIVRWRQDRADFAMTILPLNGGEVIYAQSPSQRWLINCGAERATEAVVRPFLRANGENRLPHFILAHTDVRHGGGATILWRDFSPAEILIGPAHNRSFVSRQLLEKAKGAGSSVRTIQAGDMVGPWKVVHPKADAKFVQGDDNVLVLRGEFAGRKFLFLSTLGRAGQRALLDAATDLRADIVIAGLPARDEPLIDDLLDAVQPKAIVITDAEFPAAQRAPTQLRDRLARRSCPIIYGRDAGSVTIRCRPNACQIETGAGQRWELK